MSIAGQLDVAMKQAGLAITGVTIGKEDDPATWKVQFAKPPTQAEHDLAVSVIASFKAVVEVPPPTLDKVVAALLAKGVLLPSDIL